MWKYEKKTQELESVTVGVVTPLRRMENGSPRMENEKK